MMERAVDRAAQLARARQEQAMDALARSLAGMLPRVDVRVEGAGVVASGQGLLKRWLTSGELRFLGSALR